MSSSESAPPKPKTKSIGLSASVSQLTVVVGGQVLPEPLSVPTEPNYEQVRVTHVGCPGCGPHPHKWLPFSPSTPESVDLTVLIRSNPAFKDLAGIFFKKGLSTGPAARPTCRSGVPCVGRPLRAARSPNDTPPAVSTPARKVSFLVLRTFRDFTVFRLPVNPVLTVVGDQVLSEPLSVPTGPNYE